MKEVCIYTTNMPYRDNSDIKGYVFGEGKKSLCIVGSTRGNEVQQTYIASQMVHRLKKLEERGLINPGHQIMVIPTINKTSLNVGKRFWPLDNTDINRMFPGYDKGETTQRIAAGVFEAVQGYEFGIQFTSFYRQGDFTPHVRFMDVVGGDGEHASEFGLAYVVTYKPEPFDTTTLNYNWRLWDTDAYSVYTSSTDHIEEESANIAQRACLRFMNARGMIDYPCHQGFIPTKLNEAELTQLFSIQGGIFRRLARPGDIASSGQVLAEIVSPMTGEVVEQITTPEGGVVFFTCSKPLVNEHTLVFTMVPRELARR
ncbi:MAG: M14 family metallopeptidase [Coriobacteriia bacterium]|nr:M14 family metallopeptidase [Coriobacteriia bacterium]